MDIFAGDRDERIGNKFWRNRETDGRAFIYDSPERLWDACLQYFDWVDDHPLLEGKLFGTGFSGDVKKARSMSIGAMCVHLGMGKASWHNYAHRDEFKEVCADAQNIIDTYNFELATAGLANANIIARQLGLFEKVTHSNDPDNPMPEQTVTVYQLPDNGR